MSAVNKELRQIVRSIKAYMESEKLSGVEDFYLTLKASAKESGTLSHLEEEVARCKLCPLSKSRKNPVFGHGDTRAKLVFVGEAPGRDEDEQGLPFVGRAGELLTKIIVAMGLKRSDVYICNVLKCRPPENRQPLPEEIAACRQYLDRQLALIKPKVICCLGKFACFTLLGEETPITKLRGNFFERDGIKVMPTLHPAYLLRNPDAKKLVWHDMKKIIAELKK